VSEFSPYITKPIRRASAGMKRHLSVSLFHIYVQKLIELGGGRDGEGERERERERQTEMRERFVARKEK
jgi:hypothetical protein